VRNGDTCKAVNIYIMGLSGIEEKRKKQRNT
jgi:hypothetical protein